MPGACLSFLPSEECEWSTWDIWRSWDFVQRGIFIALVLMLAYTVFVVIRFSYRYYLVCSKSGDLQNDCSTTRRINSKLTGVVSPGLGVLRGISASAPLLGLAGTSYGILNALWFSSSGSPSRYVALLFTRIAFATGTTLAGILVAIPAAACDTLFRTCTEGLSTDPSSRHAAPTREISFSHFAQTLPLKTRISKLPPFALLAAPTLACVVALFMPFHPYRIPRGLSVALPPTRCDSGSSPTRITLLRIGKNAELSINMEPETWKDLRRRLGDIYRVRASRELYLYAEDDVPFQTVADAIDIARNTPAPASDSLDVKVVLLTPNANPECAPVPVRVIPAKPTLR